METIKLTLPNFSEIIAIMYTVYKQFWDGITALYRWLKKTKQNENATVLLIKIEIPGAHEELPWILAHFSVLFAGEFIASILTFKL